MTSLLKLACVGSLFLSAGAAEAVDPAALDAWLQETVAKNHIVGLTAVITEDGKTVFKQSYGMADQGAGTAMTNDRLYHTASVSKVLVAVAVMQLSEAGKVDLDAPITAYLPYFNMDDARLPGVTVRRLLAHTAGIPDVADYGWDKPELDDGALERWVRAQRNRKLLFTPGEDREYSNIGFEILGDLIAKASGQTFEAYVKEHIFAPLGMTASSFLRADIPAGQGVWGYTGASKAYPIANYPYNRRHAPSSTFHTSADEMALWLNAFSSPERLAATGLLKPATIEEMWTVQYIQSETAQQTHGWFQRVTDTGAVLRHGGWDDGFRAEMAVYRDRDLGYALMTNMELAPVNEIADALRLAAADKPLPPVPLSAAFLAKDAYEAGGTDAVMVLFTERMAAGNRAAGYAIYDFGHDLSREGKHEDALKLARDMHAFLPEHPRLAYRVAETLYGVGDAEGALRQAELALKLRPSLAEAEALIAKIKAGN